MIDAEMVESCIIEVGVFAASVGLGTAVFDTATVTMEVGEIDEGRSLKAILTEEWIR
jgi:hypothetical protein